MVIIVIIMVGTKGASVVGPECCQAKPCLSMFGKFTSIIPIPSMYGIFTVPYIWLNYIFLG